MRMIRSWQYLFETKGFEQFLMNLFDLLNLQLQILENHTIEQYAVAKAFHDIFGGTVHNGSEMDAGA